MYYLLPAIHTEQVTVGSPTPQKQTCVEIRATHFINMYILTQNCMKV
jgi:hypothetical protein